MEQVYASFQHDETAVPAYTGMGFTNILFGTDYPHIEGTFPHTQKVLHEILDGVDDDVSYRIRLGAFLELFPSVGEPAALTGTQLLLRRRRGPGIPGRGKRRAGQPSSRARIGRNRRRHGRGGLPLLQHNVSRCTLGSLPGSSEIVRHRANRRRFASQEMRS